MDPKIQQAEIVKKVLERAAEELATELALAQEIDEDVRFADEREEWKVKLWEKEEEMEKYKVKCGILEGENNILKTAYQQLLGAVHEKEEAYNKSIYQLQEFLQNANNINVQACAQVAAFKDRITELEGQLIAVKREHLMERARTSLLMSLNRTAIQPGSCEASASLSRTDSLNRTAIQPGSSFTRESLNAPEYVPK